MKTIRETLEDKKPLEEYSVEELLLVGLQELTKRLDEQILYMRTFMEDNGYEFPEPEDIHLN